MNKKVLVVEDDPAVRKAVQFILEGNHHDVLLAADVKSGLEQAEFADVILLDLKLGHETGDLFLEELRRRRLYTPVIAFSGVYSKAEAEERLERYKIVDFMAKPFKAKDLLDKVECAGRVSDSMQALSHEADRFKAAATSLRILAGKSITQIGQLR